jgi:hypothetical protein
MALLHQGQERPPPALKSGRQCAHQKQLRSLSEKAAFNTIPFLLQLSDHYPKSETATRVMPPNWPTSHQISDDPVLLLISSAWPKPNAPGTKIKRKRPHRHSRFSRPSSTFQTRASQEQDAPAAFQPPQEQTRYRRCAPVQMLDSQTLGLGFIHTLPIPIPP